MFFDLKPPTVVQRQSSSHRDTAPWGLRCRQTGGRTYPYTNHPSSSTSPPVPQEYQNAPVASIENIAEARVRTRRRVSLRTTFTVRGEVMSRCAHRMGSTKLHVGQLHCLESRGAVEIIRCQSRRRCIGKQVCEPSGQEAKGYMISDTHGSARVFSRLVRKSKKSSLGLEACCTFADLGVFAGMRDGFAALARRYGSNDDSGGSAMLFSRVEGRLTKDTARSAVS